jgi:hypothetical protein
MSFANEIPAFDAVRVEIKGGGNGDDGGDDKEDDDE